jgi:hypothetical protein
MEKLEISISKSNEGYYNLSTLIYGEYYHKSYLYFTKRQAIKAFREFVEKESSFDNRMYRGFKQLREGYRYESKI